MATASDVARLAGTSTAVVSYVFNDGPRPVAPETRRRVLEAAEKLRYRPNPVARALSAGRSQSIGLVVPDISNPFFAEVARALENEASKRNYLLLIGDSAMDPQREDKLIETFVDRRVEALVFASLREHPNVEEATRRLVPLLALHRVTAEVHASSLTIDYEAAAFEATAHLVAGGSSRLGMLNSPGGGRAARDRTHGFLRAAQGGNATTSSRESELTRAAAYTTCVEWFMSPDRPDGLFVTCDEQAFGVLAAAHELELGIPSDIAVVAIDGTRAGIYTVPSLSSVRQPVQELAHRSLQILLERDTSAEPISETLAFTLEVRNSSSRA